MANEPTKLNPTQQLNEAKKFLLVFYEKPIAQVSTELFFTIGATIFFAAFAIRPTIITMTELVKEIEDKEKALAALERKTAALSTVQNEYFTLQDQFYLLDETIPPTIAFESVLKTIEKTASDQQISITSLQLQEVPFSETELVAFDQKTPIVADLTVSITGSFLQVRDFVDGITQLRPLLTVDSINLTDGGIESEQDYLNATIRMQAHYYSKDRPRKDDEETPPQVLESEETL